MPSDRPAAGVEVRLGRVEPVIALAMTALGAVMLPIDGPVAWWRWLLLAAMGLVGAMGLFERRLIPSPVVRATILLGCGWLIAATAHQPAGGLVFLVLATTLVYPLLLDRPASWWLLAAGVSGYAGLQVLGAEPGLVLVRNTAGLTAIAAAITVLGHTALRHAGQRIEAESELARAQVRFRAAFANASSGMAILAGRSERRVNQAFCDFLHRTEDELAQVELRDLVHPDDVPDYDTRMTELLDREVWSFQCETRFLRPEGQVAWGLVGASLMEQPGDKEPYVFLHVQDITERVKAREALRESERHYRDVFGWTPVGTWEMDFSAVAAWLDELRARGVGDIRDYLRGRPVQLREVAGKIRVVDVNDAAIELMDAPGRDELLAKAPIGMGEDGDPEVVIEQFAALWEGRRRLRISIADRTVRGRSIKGIMHWAVPEADDGARHDRVIAAFTDLTQHAEAEEALRRVEERLRTVVSASPIMLFALDQYGVFTLAEGQGLAGLGITAGEAIGRSVFEMFHAAPDMIAAVRRAVGGESFTTAVEIGSLVFDIRFSPIWEKGRVAGVIGVANDITERTRSAERLEQLVRSKDEFVASVSHELRTPLTAVVGFATEMRDSYEVLTDDDRLMFVNLIAAQSIEVADLVEDLLVAARVDMDTVSIYPEVLDVFEQVDGALATWPPDLAATVERVGGPAKVYADPIRVRQIIRNLLSNAQRYGGDRIRVAVEAAVDGVSIVVADDGAGIPVRDRSRIFEPYHRAHADASQPQSVGLGLTVSRQLAMLMDGDLAYSYEGGWSRFELALPAPT